MGIVEAVKRLCQLDKAKAKKKRCKCLRFPVPHKLQHFLYNRVCKNEKNAPKGFASGIIDL